MGLYISQTKTTKVMFGYMFLIIITLPLLKFVSIVLLYAMRKIRLNNILKTRKIA